MILDMYKTKAQLEVPDYIKFTGAGPDNHVKRDAELTVRSDDQGMAYQSRCDLPPSLVKLLI